MLENIKSTFFIKIVFSLIADKTKLEVLKYNKSLQNKNNINLLNYKLFSKKYIINYRKNGKVKEYNSYNDTLIFEGEYKNGRRNGIGKEYDSNNIIYEGEYLNGKRNGHGIEYNYIDGIYIFIGTYLNGKKWNGKIYDTYNKIISEIKKGKGIIKLYYINYGVLKFKGEYIKGEINGNGIEYYTNGNIKFKGKYLNGNKWEGKGYDINKKIIYELKEGKGTIKEYHFNGKLKSEYKYINGRMFGKEYNYSGKLIYEGEYLNECKWNGTFREYKSGKLIFEGEYLYGCILRGKKYIRGILEFEGEYLFNKKWNGKGYDEYGNIIYELHNGNGKIKEYDDIYNILIFEGEYLNGKRNGKGKEYYKNGNILFEGIYKKGKRWEGKGYDPKGNIKYEIKYGKGYIKEYDYINGLLIFEGEYLNGEINGKGKEYDHKGNLIFEGNYINGVINGIGKEYDEGNLIFEGEYKNGKKNGRGIEYDKNCKILFEGEYINGEKNGKGIEYDKYGNFIFEGLYINDVRWNGLGKGFDYFNGQKIYEGAFPSFLYEK